MVLGEWVRPPGSTEVSAASRMFPVHRSVASRSRGRIVPLCSPGVLHEAGGTPVQDRHEPVGMCPEEGQGWSTSL